MKKFRRKIGKKRSKKLFTKTASRVHGKNARAVVRRGGTRL